MPALVRPVGFQSRRSRRHATTCAIVKVPVHRPRLPDPEAIPNRIGNFVVEELIGEGAMGSVYAARHASLGMKVAVKVLKPHLCGSNELISRFMVEARVVSAMLHPALVRIVDFGRLPSGQLYSIMEFLDGRDLEQVLEETGVLAPGHAASIAAQAAAALSVVHEQNIVHRDLKPANLFLAKDNSGQERLKVLDFGIAKLLELTGDSRLTQAGIILGTPLYMAPEQAAAAGAIDQRADVYSLGCVLYEMLTGQAPFDGDTPMMVLAAHAHDVPEPPSRLTPGIGADYDAVVLRCLEKDPARRFQSMRQLEDALRALRLD